MALTRDEVRRVDRLAMERLGVPGLLLMENAGRQVADAVVTLRSAVAELEGSAAGPVVVVAGGGNNGGDGFVCSRHLIVRGIACETVLLQSADRYTGDAAANLRFLQSMGAPIVEACDASSRAMLAGRLASASVIVDAIGGTGIVGPLRPALADAVTACNDAGRPIVAVDIPTGLDCDNGLPVAGGPCIRATRTVTFVATKRGFDNPASREFTGETIVADIGVPGDV